MSWGDMAEKEGERLWKFLRAASLDEIDVLDGEYGSFCAGCASTMQPMFTVPQIESQILEEP